MILSDLQPVYTSPPTYIKEITKSSENFYLLYKTIQHVKHSSNTENDTKQNIEDTSISLDLTGNPLPVDLSSDVSFLPLEEQIWLQEDNHHPLSLETVRRSINKFNKESRYGNATIYGICDGMDKKCTLVLGACQTDDYLGRMEICNLGCFYQNDAQISLEKMMEFHYDNVGRSKCQVNSLINATYTIYGNNLRNYKISNISPYNSCILYNASWNTYQYKVPEFVQSAEMTLQTIIGHKESEMHIFWEQFMLLKMYTVLLLKEPTDLESIVLSDNPKNYITICEDICCVLQEMEGAQKVVLKKEAKNILDVNNLRKEDLIDKLWRILISCTNVGDLKICFHTLFEELAMKETVKPFIPDNNTSSIAIIINEISSGKLAVPTLTSLQALQCLIELGIEKLKSDYFYILKHFDCMDYDKFESCWSDATDDRTLDTKITTSSSRVTKHTLDRVAARRMRLTTQSSISLIEVSQRFTKLNCLLKLHIASSFLIFGDRSQLLTYASFNPLVEFVKDYIIKLDNTTLVKNYPDYALEEITVKLRSREVKGLQSKEPIAWNVRLVSMYNRSVVTTIFHHTLRPVFPPCIYNKYDVPHSTGNDSTDNIYYVTRMVNFIEKL